MTHPSHDHQTDPPPHEPEAKPDPEMEELRRQVMAHIQEFGPRKYQAYYTQAKQLKESGLDPGTVRKSLIVELPATPPIPEGGVHLISRVHGAKQKAIYHVVRNAIEDALARRPPLFRLEHAEQS